MKSLIVFTVIVAVFLVSLALWVVTREPEAVVFMIIATLATIGLRVAIWRRWI